MGTPYSKESTYYTKDYQKDMRKLVRRKTEELATKVAEILGDDSAANHASLSTGASEQPIFGRYR
jgi:hypothetical protein